MLRYFGIAFAALATSLTSPAALMAAENALTIAVPTDVQSWDPMSTNATAQTLILRNVFDAPLTQTPDLTLIPNVISEWKWIGEDGLALEVTLRDDVLFHNGDKLTTRDLRFSYVERLQNEKNLPFAGVFNPVLNDVEIVSDTKAIFRMKKPMPTLPNWLAFLGQYIVPKDYFEKVGRDGFMAKPVGSGPYKLVEYQQGARIVLEAFDKYWNGKPANERLTFEIVKDPTARVAAIQAGRVDIATAVPIREATRLNGSFGLVANIEPTSEIVFLNVKNEGAYLDENVRLAAAHSIDRAALSKAFFGGKAIPVTIPGPPSLPGYPKDFKFGHDPELSRQLLAKSGFSTEKPVKIGFVTTNGAYANDYEVARAISGMWAQVGIQADMQVVELSKYYELNRGGKLPETSLSVWSNATNDPELYTGSMLDPNSRFSVWKSADMGEKIAPLLTETDQAKRIAGYTAASIYAVERGYTMPLMQAVTTVVYKKDLNFTWFQNTWFEPYKISWK